MPQTSRRVAFLLVLLLGVFAAGLGAAAYDLLYGLPFLLLQAALLWLLSRTLRASEQRFAKLFHANPAAIVLMRAGDGAYLDVNAAFVELFGYSREELIGANTVGLGLLPAATRAALRAEVARTGHAYGRDLRVTAKDGRIVDVLYALEPIDLDGGRALLALALDITDRKRMEEELRLLNQELEDRVALRTADLHMARGIKNEFLALVSHELRTPLSGVLTLTETLADEISGPLTPRQARYVASIRQSGERLLEIVNVMLNYTLLVSGEVEFAAEPCDLPYLLGLAATSQRYKAEARCQALTVSVPPALTIRSDPQAIVQIGKHLLDNAIKFTPEGGCVGVSAECTPTAVRIVVWDTGVGLPHAGLAEVVKPFTQVAHSLTRSRQGIGMGLAYIDQLLPLLGGSLSYEPNPGGGSRFIVTLAKAPGCKEGGSSAPHLPRADLEVMPRV
jgi:PAS domain S-box-containing protein